jgi:two-component system sensor histidine kinase BarA
MNAQMKVIDQDLALERAGGNAQLAAELFSMLLQELPQQRNAIEAALAAGDFPALQHFVHKLNGSATYCGVPALKTAAATLETSLKRGDTSQAASGVATILEEIERVLGQAA